MAPTRVVSSAGSGVIKKPQRKRPARREPSDGWDFALGDERGKTNGSVRATTERAQSTSINGSHDVDEALAPLRDVAERVGSEVERFAETLDKFFNDLPTIENRYEAAIDLVDDFHQHANDVLNDLKKGHERELRQQLRKEWREQARVSGSSAAFEKSGGTSGAALSVRQADRVAELRAWQQEADLWELFRIMLFMHPFEADAQKRRQETEEVLARMGPPHHYMSESELWDRFLLENDLAKERQSIKEWLEKAAQHQQSDLSAILEELETKAGRGKGLWSSGWLHTRERIKGEKRMRSWPNAAESPLPQVRRSDNNDMLVTTLDPDAPNRQHRTLEQPDSFFERAMWIACWEMLRRGKSWQEICAWSQDRKDGWRAICLGAAVDRLEETASTSAFRAMCHQISQSGLANEYEAAVFGLLGGDIKTVEKISKTLDDRLYAYYNSTLLQQFDEYLKRICPSKAPPISWQRDTSDAALHDPEEAEVAIQSLIFKLRNAPETSGESAQPMKIIQSYLLADEVGSLVHTVGTSIAATASLQGREDVMFLRNRDASRDMANVPEREVALDPQTLRIAAHMSIVHRVLSPDYLQQLPGDELMEDENVLVAYIQALRTAGKRDLIPIYASKLQRERYIIVLGRMLQDVTDLDEQGRMLGLLREYDLDLTAILTEQLRWVFVHSLPGPGTVPPLRVLERTADTKVHPGQMIIDGFLDAQATSEDVNMVTCLGWFQNMHGEWKLMFEALSVALRKCLIHGRIACARMIAGTYPYDEVSLRKSYETVGRAIHLMETNAEPHNEEEQLHWELLQRQSATYYELTQLMDALEALAEWRDQEHKYVNKAPRPLTVPSALKDAFAKVTATIEPILHGILRRPIDHHEEADLEFIRMHYIPEIVLAYNTVLHAAGNFITRDALLESMELSILIANPQRDGIENGLEECFVKAGRMRELVDSFALTSKVMLILKAEGKAWKMKRERHGKDLGIWEINGTHEVED